MNAKTTKFLAVLAVLAVAFAGCVILLGEQNDAAGATEVTKDTYPTTGGPISSIELEGDADAKSVVLYDDSTEIESPYAYFFAEDASLFMSEDVLLSAPVMFFVLDGVELSIVAPTDKEFTDFGLIEFVFVKSYDPINGIITLAEDKTFDKAGYAKVIGDIVGPNTYASDANISYQKGDSFSIVADGEKAKKFVLGAIKALDLYADATATNVAEFNLAGEIETVTIKTDKTAAVLTDFTGTVTDGTDSVELSGFTGKIVKDSKLKLTGWVAGTLVSYTKSTTLVFDQIVFTEVGQYATFGKNVEIPVAQNTDTAEVKFKRYVRDNYTLNVNGTLTAGSNGLTVAAGINGLEVSGSAAITGAATLTFTGAAKVSGTFNVNGGTLTIAGNVYQITLENLRIDNVSTVTLTGETVIEKQVTINGSVITAGKVIVAPEANLNITNELQYTDKETKIFVGKNASLRMKAATTSGTALDYKDEKWAEMAFVDSTGSIYLNQNKVTSASAAVVAYLFQIGAGTVSINSSISSTNSEYYIYNQVIPYLSLNPVDVVCTSMIAEKAEISLRGVESTGGELPIGNQARYTIDYSTGVPMFYVEFKELYTVQVLNAYGTDGKQKIAIYDEDKKEVDMIKDTTTATTGIVKLAFNYNYTIQGINEKNKYTFKSVKAGDPAETIIDFERQNNFASKFTMVRQALVPTQASTIAGDSGEIQCFEGLAMTLTVKINDIKDELAVGNVFMYYTVVDEEGAEPQDDEAVAVYVTEDDDDNLVGIITGIYSTDKIFFKFAETEFFKLYVPKETTTTVTNIVGMDNTSAAIPIPVKTWTAGYTFTTTAKTSSFPVVCDQDKTTVSFTFQNATAPANQELVIEFTNYCGDATLHGKTVKLKANTEIEMCVGEVYTMTLKDIKGYIPFVMYPNPEYTTGSQTQPEFLAYDGEGVTAKYTEVPLAYTIVYEELKELEITNKYSKSITVTVGDYSVEIAKDATEKLVVNQGWSNKTRLTGEPMELSMIGYDVKKWYYTTYNKTTGEADTDKMPVLVDNSVTPDSVETILKDKGMKIDINDVRADRILYLVKVDPIYQKVITYYDQSGYYGTPMVAYVQPEFGEKTFGVEYVYTVDGVEISGEAVQDFTPEGEEFWAYNMPAYDVELRPIIAKPTYDVTFVDAATGETVGEAVPVEPFSINTIDIPHNPGYKAVSVVKDEKIEGELIFIEEDQTVTFDMPDDNVVIEVTYDMGGPFSDDVNVSIKHNIVTLAAVDGETIQGGVITVTYYYWAKVLGAWKLFNETVTEQYEGGNIVDQIEVDIPELTSSISYVKAAYVSYGGYEAPESGRTIF